MGSIHIPDILLAKSCDCKIINPGFNVLFYKILIIYDAVPKPVLFIPFEISKSIALVIDIMCTCKLFASINLFCDIGLLSNALYSFIGYYR